LRIFLLAIGLASLLGAGAASAGTLVEFPNFPGHTPANLSGYLARPDSGLSTSSIRRGWPSSANRWTAKRRSMSWDRDLAAQFFKERFRAAIAYYPYCDIPRQR
jgi:hypothetical protein